MKTHMLRSLALGASAALYTTSLVSAQPTAFFDKYVALGDSLTAGVESNCLVQRNQVNSFPAVLARTLFITDFQQPLVQEIPLTNPLVGTVCLGPLFTPPSTFGVTPVSQMGAPLNALLSRPYDNLGMPGARVADLTQVTHGDPDGTGIEQIAALVLRNVTGSPFDGLNAVDEANILLAPTQNRLTTLWIGNNDVLGAATSGIVVDGVTVTSLASFVDSYEAILDALPPQGAMVLANIPDVTAIPFTTTIPPILVNPATRQPVIIDGHTVPLLGQGDREFPCVPVPPDQGCPLPAGSLVTLPASSLLGQGIGVPVAAGGTGAPLPHGFIDATGLHAGVTLYPDEVALLQERVIQYNDAIESFPPITVVDVYGIFNDIRAHGYHVGGIDLTPAFISGGIFSYDGVHPSTIGYTIIADAFIQAMNEAVGQDQFPRPDFSEVLFTPNVPATGGNLRVGGPWGYTFETWREVLSKTLREAAAVTLPGLSRGIGDRETGTRTVTRAN
jgi:lysophospholipase L1-like esterase